MPNIGLLEILIVLIIVLIVFGPKRLPEMGRSLGRGIREFKDSVTGKRRGRRAARDRARRDASETTRPGRSRARSSTTASPERSGTGARLRRLDGPDPAG